MSKALYSKEQKKEILKDMLDHFEALHNEKNRLSGDTSPFEYIEYQDLKEDCLLMFIPPEWLDYLK